MFGMDRPSIVSTVAESNSAGGDSGGNNSNLLRQEHSININSNTSANITSNANQSINTNTTTKTTTTAASAASPNYLLQQGVFQVGANSMNAYPAGMMMTINGNFVNGGNNQVLGNNVESNNNAIQGMMLPSMQPQQPIYTAATNSQQIVQPVNTPWSLGSTDGSFATSLILWQRQQQQLQSSPSDINISPATANSSVSITGSDGSQPQALYNNNNSNNVNNINSSNNNIINGSTNNSNNHNTATLLSAEASEALSTLALKKSLYQDRIFRQPSASVEAVLAAGCEVMGFDIAEMWLRTGAKTHQLTNSHLRPTSLEDSVRKDLVDVYYGEKSSERTHRLSPALCKRAKEANDVVWVTAHTPYGAEALRCSISNVRTAVAIPVCHEASNTNITIIFFSIRRILVRPAAVEFLVHMALAAGAASVNSLAEEGLIDRDHNTGLRRTVPSISRSEHVPRTQNSVNSTGSNINGGIGIRHQRVERVSVTGAQLDLQWRQLHNVEYLTDGGNSWIHTAVFNAKPVVVKTLKPECQDVAVAINEIEGELDIHSRLNHPNICALFGAGNTSKGVRFVVLERLDGGTLTQMLGYDTRIRDRRRRFWRRKQFSFLDVLRIARSIAEAMAYCHEKAIPGCIVLHRDLKPDNIGFTLDGTVKLLDFGLAKIVENASVNSDEVYHMSGETGSLRYMAPEVADGLPYNWGADVYSFGIILWEINATKKPFDGLNREMFYERVVHGGERPSLNRKWPKELTNLMQECWDADMHNRPRFRQIVERLDALMEKEKGGTRNVKKSLLPKISGMIDRHSTWF